MFLSSYVSLATARNHPLMNFQLFNFTVTNLKPFVTILPEHNSLKPVLYSCLLVQGNLKEVNLAVTHITSLPMLILPLLLFVYGTPQSLTIFHQVAQ